MILSITIIDPAGAHAPFKSFVNMRHVMSAVLVKDKVGKQVVKLITVTGMAIHVDEPMEHFIPQPLN